MEKLRVKLTIRLVRSLCHCWQEKTVLPFYKYLFPSLSVDLRSNEHKYLSINL